MVGLDVGPASDDADVEPIEVAGEVLVDSLLELEHVLGASQIVEGWQADILSLDQSILDNLLVVLSNLDSAQV